MKIKNIFTAIFICTGLSGFSQQIISGFANPESIASDGERYFVSNRGKDINPSSKDGDGFITEISSDGKLIEQKFLPQTGVLSDPKGLTIANNILYVADIDRIVGFDIRTKKTVFELTIPQATVLNDICRLENGFIAVSETASGDIYKVNTKNKTFETIGNIPTANGINYNPKTKQLVVCSSGENFSGGSVYIKTGNGGFKELPHIAKGVFDGIEWVDDSHLMISDWVEVPVKGIGKIWIYDLEAQTSQAYFTSESIADIYYNPVSQKIYIPQMLHSKVIIVDKNDLKSSERYQLGWEKMKEVDGEAGDKLVRNFKDISPDLGNFIIEYAFGDIYTRNGLDLKSKEIAALSGLIALGNASPQVRLHINGVLNTGSTISEVKEVILQMSVYSGFPSSINAMNALKEVLAERKGRGIKDDEGKKTSVTSSDRLKLGEQELSKLDSEQVANARKYWSDVSPELFQFTLEYAYGDIFSRDNLSIKHRQIATIAGLTALGTGVPQLKFHINGALNIGISKEEINEIMLLMSVYAGFPAAINGTVVLKKVIAERNN